jgi:hypothetical protein
VDFQTSALILAWVAILVLALAMSGLLRQVHALSPGHTPQQQLGPPLGSAAPPLHPSDRTEWDAVTIALFLDRSCEVCERNLRLAEELALANAGRLRFLAIFPADADGLQQRQVEVIENAHETFTRYRVPLTPYGVVIGSDGRVVQAAPLGSDALLKQLVDNTPTGR